MIFMSRLFQNGFQEEKPCAAQYTGHFPGLGEEAETSLWLVVMLWAPLYEHD